MKQESKLGYWGEVSVIYHVLEVEENACTGVRRGVGEHDNEWQLWQDLGARSVGKQRDRGSEVLKE